MKILLICVSYFNEDEVIRFVKNILESDDHKVINIAIVNNSSNNRSINKFNEELSELSGVYIYNSEENLGYLNGMNMGRKEFIKETGLTPKWTIVSNTDISFHVERTINYLINYKEEHILAPNIVSMQNKTQQNPFLINRISKNKLNLLKIIYSNYFSAFIYELLSKLKRKNKYLMKNKEIKDCVSIYAPHGSFIVLPEIFFVKGGNLVYNSFLFGEEIYIGEQAMRIGISVFYDKNISIDHYEHSTTSLMKIQNMAKNYYESMHMLKIYLYGEEQK